MGWWQLREETTLGELEYYQKGKGWAGNSRSLFGKQGSYGKMTEEICYGGGFSFERG